MNNCIGAQFHSRLTVGPSNGQNVSLSVLSRLWILCRLLGMLLEDPCCDGPERSEAFR